MSYYVLFGGVDNVSAGVYRYVDGSECPGGRSPGDGPGCGIVFRAVAGADNRVSRLVKSDGAAVRCLSAREVFF